MDKSDNELLRGELIGGYATVKGKNIYGRIIDETKNIFLIETKKDRRKVSKKNNMFEFLVKNKKISVDGKMLVLRPEDRIKTKW